MTADVFPGPSLHRTRLYNKIMLFRSDGMTNDEIAAALGLGAGYVRDVLHDPSGERNWERRRSYRGVCENCGRQTDGSNGRDNASRYCHLCAPTIYAELKRIWTRDTVIEAIQTWAAEHDGVPPTADDWRSRSTDGRFPATSSVYRKSGRGPKKPFESWADAVEQAGFRRPIRGRREGERVWDKQLVIDTLRAVAVDGYAPSTDYDHSLHYAAMRYWGSWHAAIAEAGLKPLISGGRVYERKWSKEKIIQAIRELAIGDLPPASSEDQSLFHQSRLFFHSWADAVSEAGYEPYIGGSSRRSKRRRQLLAEFRGGR